MENFYLKSLKAIGISMLQLNKEINQLLQQEIKKQVAKEIKKVKLGNDELLTATQVRETFKISQSTLERYVRSGLKFSSNAKGCKRLFKRSDVETFKKIKNGR